MKKDGWEVVSQNPDIAPPHEKEYAEKNYLPALMRAWKIIERYTGYRWKSTSYWRASPSHSTGAALDIAPDIAPYAAHKYAVTNKSDPVLYKRERLIRVLQDVAANYPVNKKHMIGVFIEPDHLHIQLLHPDKRMGGMRIVKWGVSKPVYKDTEQRKRLPLIRTNA